MSQPSARLKRKQKETRNGHRLVENSCTKCSATNNCHLLILINGLDGEQWVRTNIMRVGQVPDPLVARRLVFLLMWGEC